MDMSIIEYIIYMFPLRVNFQKANNINVFLAFLEGFRTFDILT